MGQKLSEFRSSSKSNMEEKRNNEISISLERIQFGIGLPGINAGAMDENDSHGNNDAPSRLNEHFEHLYSSESKDKDKEKDSEDNGNSCVKPSTSAELDEAHCSNYCPDSTQRHENLRLFGPPETRKSKSRRKKSQKKESNSREKKKRAHWVLRFNCARLKSGSGSSGGSSEPEVTEPIASCICTGCKRSADEHHLSAGVVLEARQRRDSTASSDSEHATHHLLHFPDNPTRHFIDFTNRIRYREDVAVEDCDERARIERAREIAEGMEPPPGYRPKQHIQLVYAQDMICLDGLTVLLHSAALSALSQLDTPNIVHTQVDYIHCLVPDLLQITSCSFYWGKMDRYEAERLLEGKPEGTFLLRDSAQEEYLFSVSFRKYGRSLHARIEQWKHMFSFDSHDPGVYSSPTVCGLIEHYKDPSCCMFFEPTLTYPLHRNFSFALQHLCRAVICSKISYDGIAQLRLPKALKSYLKEYHYKQRVKVRVFDSE